MDLAFIGTGAADWPKEPILDAASLERGELRAFTATLLDTRVLIDCGPHAMDEMRVLGIEASAIDHVLITHSHGDHLHPEVLQELAANRPQGDLAVHGDPEALRGLEGIPRVDCRPFSIGSPVDVAHLTILPLRANHPLPNPQENPLHFLIDDGTTRLLYALDGAWVLPETFRELRKTTIDAIVWDATIGEVYGDARVFEHNSLPMLRLMAAALRGCGVLKEDAPIFLTHLARTLHDNHATIAEAYARDGFTVAHDGMEASV